MPHEHTDPEKDHHSGRDEDWRAEGRRQTEKECDETDAIRARRQAARDALTGKRGQR